MKTVFRTCFSIRPACLAFGLALVFAPLTATKAATWPMRQRDTANTGRADFAVPASRLNTNFFSAIRWQKPSPDSPGDGHFQSSSMVFFDGAGPDGSDVVAATYHWPIGVQGMDRHTGARFWSGNPDGGELIASMTPAFSTNGSTLFVVNDATPGPLMAFVTSAGPSSFRHNGDDAEPAQLEGLAPKVAADGRIFSHRWDDRPYAGTDSGTAISVSWSAASGVCACFNSPALWAGPDGLRVASAGRCGVLAVWDGDSGDELWQVGLPAGSDADATIDPVNGNIYQPVGLDSIWIAGIDKDGQPLWSEPALLAYEWQEGVNNPQRAQSAGCLAADGASYYFQTVSEQGDGRLYAIRTADGSVKWSVNTASLGWEDVCSSPIVASNGIIIVGNNSGGAYYAIQDVETNGEVLATLPVSSGGKANCSATLSPDGLLYLPVRMDWVCTNGDDDAPTHEPANVFTAFDLNDGASLPTAGGTLYIELQATNRSAGSAAWINQGTLGNFTRHGAPILVTNVANTGFPGVFFEGTEAFYEGPATVSDLDDNSDRSVEVWVFNPELSIEETVVGWGSRWIEDGANFGIGYGSDLGYGAVSHWSWDMGWGETEQIPASNTWHHFVYTYNGGLLCKFYVDGQLLLRSELPNLLSTFPGQTILIGAQHEGSGFQMLFSGYINTVRIYGGVLSSNEIAARFALGPATNPPTPVELQLQVISPYGTPTPAVGLHTYTNGATVTASVPSSTAIDGGRKYLCTGWTGTGSIGNGTSRNVTFTITNNSSLTWLWTLSQYRLGLATNGNGRTDPGSQWYVPGATQIVIATPDIGGRFDHWSGDTNGCLMDHHIIQVTMDQPREITAHFSALLSPWRQVALPDSGNRGSHTALGSDGTNLFYTRADQASAAFWRIPKGSTSSADWQSRAALPITYIHMNSGAGDLGYVAGCLYTFTAVSSDINAARAICRYIIGEDRWEMGTARSGMPQWACAPANSAVFLGAVGNQLKTVNGWQSGGISTYATMPGGSTHPLDACLGGGYAYFLKHRYENRTNGVLSRVNPTGNADLLEIGGVPFNVGVGSAIEYVPGQWFRDGHDRLWVLSGGYSTNDAQGTYYSYWADGFFWTDDMPTNNLAVYDLVAGNWTVGTLPFAVDDGSEMCLVGDTMYFLAANGVANPLRFCVLNDTNTPASLLLTIRSDHAGAQPTTGPHEYVSGQSIVCTAPELVREGGIEYRCTGWEGTGSVFHGTGMNVTVRLDEDSSLAWLWITNRYLLTVSSLGSGHADVDLAWIPAGALKTITARPAPGWQFAEWTGETNGCSTHQNTITVRMNLPRQITARFVRSSPITDATRFVSPSGSHTAPFNSWLTAATNIQAALDAAATGETILVTNGTFSLGNEISLSKGVALKSVNGPGLTVLDGGNLTRCLQLSHTNALVDGFTITRGWTTYSGGGVLMNAGTLRHSLVLSNRSTLGSGGGIVVTQGCLVEYCQVVGNSATNGSGGGIAELCNSSGPSRVENCLIARNEAKTGGGASSCTSLSLRNALIIQNRALNGAGGVFGYQVQMANCTVVENSAQYAGGVNTTWTSGSSIVNCIIERNSIQTGTATNYACGGSPLTHTYTTPSISGFATAPEYVGADMSDYRLRPNSAGIDQGALSDWMADAVDLDGNARLVNALPDLGAWEYSAADLFCDLAQRPVTAFFGDSVEIKAAVFGQNTNWLWFYWDLDDDGQYEAVGQGLDAVSHTYTTPGTYGVSLLVSNALGQVANIRRSNAVEVGVRNIYVAPDGFEVAPYTNWVLATHSIEAALAVARHGCVVWVADGYYQLTNEARVPYAITLQSVNGADATYILGCSTNRCLWIGHSNALVQGFTITNGYVYGRNGGGAYLENGTLANCTVAGNRAVKDSSSYYGYGGGIYLEQGAVQDCVIVSNTATDGSKSRGAVYVQGGTVNRCVIRNNAGGGCNLYGGVLRNSLIASNTAPQSDYRSLNWGDLAAGVVVREGLMENCTVAGNLTIPYTLNKGNSVPAVIAWLGTIRNCIIASNFCTAELEQNSVSSTVEFVCCSSNVSGHGSFQADPRFMDPADGDYRLRPDSPCVNAGQSQAWMNGATDLDGQPRLLDGLVDQGAFEFNPGQLTLQWASPSRAYLHGSASLAWETLTGRSDPMSITLDATRLGASTTLGSGLNRTGSLTWDTSQAENGQYTLRLTLLDEQGNPLAESSRIVLVNNTLSWHSGTITLSETWSNDTVHLIEAPLTIAAGHVLTLQPGTIIKSAPGVQIILEDGARLVAHGTSGEPIIFTSLADDAAGGDTNGDGSGSQPKPGDWLGFDLQGAASLDFNNDVEIRCWLIRHAGSIAENTLWTGSALHWITDNVTVTNNATLTIGAGAVVKFNAGRRLIVPFGSTLISDGTVSRPTTFTSISDGTIAGDTNGNGLTNASPGDWIGLSISGSARLKHTSLRYGAGGNTYDMPAMVKVEGPGADVTLVNCRLEQALHDAVATFGGTTRLTNCILAHNGRGVLVRENSTNTVVNCTLYQHNWGLVPHGGVMRVLNTIVADSGQYGVFGTPTEFAYNNVWSSTSSSYLAGNDGNVSVDPKFRNADAGNYQLAYLSPMIDAADTTRASPADFMGAPRYDDPRSSNSGVVGILGAMADMGAFEFVEGAASDLDLIAQNVVGPSAATAGETIHVSWRIKNQGSAVLSGQWHDQLLLVPDASDGWNGPMVVAEVVSAATLGPDATADFSADVRVPGGTEGGWRWRVKANAQGEIFEGLNWNNNISELSAPMALSIPALSINGTLEDMFVSQGKPAWFKITNAASSDVSLGLDTAITQGRVRLYVGLERMPSELKFDRRSEQWNVPDVTLLVPSWATAGNLYLMAVPEELPYAPARFALTSSTVEFGVSSVSPAVVGNGGDATLEIHGYGFTINTQARLVPAGAGTNITALRWVLADSTRGYATFDLRGVTEGLYHSSLQDSGRSATRSNTVVVVASAPGAGEFQARLSAPSAVRAGRVFRGFVNYQNVGKTDMPAPLLVLEADAHTVLYPAGMPGQAAQRLHFLAGAQGRPQPSILSPGTQYAFHFQGVSSGNDAISIRLYRLGANNADPLDYVSLRDDIQPDAPHPLFSSAYERMVSELGPTRGDYVLALGEAADRAARCGETSLTEQSLLTYLIRESVEAVQHATVSGTAYLTDTNHPLDRVQVFLTPLDHTNTNLYGTTAWYDGTFGIRSVPPGTYWVSLQHYLPPRITLVTVADTNNPVTGLSVVAREPAVEIAGTITEAASAQPVTNATLVVRDFVGAAVGFGATDTNGSYRVRDLYPGVYRLEIDAPGTLPEPMPSITVESNKTAYRSFVLSRSGAVIQGEVRTPGSAAVAGALVSAAWLDHTTAYGTWHAAQTRSDADGSYALTALPPGRYAVSASSGTAGSSDEQDVQLTSASATANANLVMRGDVSISGAVVDAGNGSPVTNATVAVALNPAWDTIFTTDAAGHFMISNLTVGTWLLNGYAEGYSIGKTNLLVTSAGSHAVVLPLSPKGEVTARVRNDGSPLEGAVVTVMPWAAGQVQTLHTATNGECRLTHIPPGQYSILLGGVGGLSFGRQDFEVRSTNRSHSFIFDTALSRISGQVLAPDGITGVTNATVYLLGHGEVISAVQTDASGDYSLVLFEPGTFDLLVMGGEFSLALATDVVVTNSTSTVKMDFVQPTNALTVQVSRQSGGQPLSNVWVELRPVAGLGLKVQAPLLLTETTGSVRFSGVAEGDYRLSAHASDHALYQAMLRVSNGLAHVDVALAAGRRVHGQVTSNETALAFAWVDLASTNGVVLISALTDTNGNYELTSVPQGVFDIIVRPDVREELGSIIRSGVDLTSASERLEDFELASHAITNVSGIIIDGAGRRVTGAVVQLVHGGDSVVAATLSDARGQFTLRHCPAGRFRLDASAFGYAGTNQMLELGSGSSTTGLELRLSRPISADGAVPDAGGIRASMPGVASRGAVSLSANGTGVDRDSPAKNAEAGEIDTFAGSEWDESSEALNQFAGENYRFWQDVLSGTMGLADPQLAFKNAGVDLRHDILEPFDQAEAAGRIRCVLEARDEALQRYKNLNAAIASWSASFLAAKQLNQANVDLALSRAALVAAKTAKLIATFGTPTGSESLAGLSPEMQSSIISTIDNVGGWAAAVRQGEASGNFDEGGATITAAGSVAIASGWIADGKMKSTFSKLESICEQLDTLKQGLQFGQGLPSNYADQIKNLEQSARATDEKLANWHSFKETKVDRVAKVLDVLDAVWEIKTLMGDLTQMNTDVVNVAGDYLSAQDTYLKALLSYHKARRKLQALARDCKVSDGTIAKNPDYPADNEVTKVDISKPYELDPNDKITTGLGAFGCVQGLDLIYYTIHFENVSTASAPAQLVVITDALHPSLDETTFELDEIAFNNVVVWPPVGLTRFEATTNVATDPNPVHIQAGLNVTNRTVTWTLQSVDPSTGDYPEDPWAGFLPPNTTNQIGEGYVTFSIRPKTNANGVYITNQSVIVFGVNAPIATPVVTNLVDSTPPVSAVNPLAEHTATASFTVSWSGTDAGAGVAGYDIYVSSNSGPWQLWLSNTALISATFPGHIKTTYGFYSIGTDKVGNVEEPPATADATTTTANNQAPILAPISDGIVAVNQTLTLTNEASDLDGDALTFSLTTKPAGASITPGTGVLTWTPTCAQGSTTNHFEVVVTDNGTPPLSASQQFQVIVPECIEAGLGCTVLQVGTTSSVPVQLLSTVALTNLSFTVVYPAERLTNFLISPNSSQVLTQELRLLSPGRLEVRFTLPGESALHGPTNAAELAFFAPTNQSSAFVPLHITDLTARRPDGGLAANASGQRGRVAIIAVEPLVEGVRGTDGKPHVLLYGNPGVAYSLDYRTNLSSGLWQPLGSLTMTNLVRDAHTGETGNRKIFFRARKP